MRGFTTVLFSVLLAIGAAALTARHNEGTVGESAYDRVQRTGVLRCGYFEEAPFTIVDPYSGKKSGISVELTERIAADNGWKVEWTTPIAFATFVTDLKESKFDAVCGSVFMIPRSNGHMIYSQPYAQFIVQGYAHAGNVALQDRIAKDDWKNIRIAGIEGEGASKMAKAKYKNAQFVMMPQSVSIAEMLTSVLGDKADIAFVLPTEFAKFETANPGEMTVVSGLEPLGAIQIGIGVAAKEQALRDVIDITINDMSLSGALEQLIAKYDPDGVIAIP